MGQSHVVCALVLALGAARLAAAATKFSVKTVVQSPLPAQFGVWPNPYNASLPKATQPCNVPGICYPYNVTLNASTLWVWCGFASTHKSYYTVKSTLPRALNLTTQLMRRKVLENCGYANLTNLGSCATIASSLCDTTVKCDKRTFGLSFYDEICLVIANNQKNATGFTVQMINAYDSPRYYGTVFVLFFTITMGLFILAYWYVNVRREVLRPIVQKGHHSSSNEVAKFDTLPEDESEEPATPTLAQRFKNKVSSAKESFVKLLPGRKPTGPPVHASVA